MLAPWGVFVLMWFGLFPKHHIRVKRAYPTVIVAPHGSRDGALSRHAHARATTLRLWSYWFLTNASAISFCCHVTHLMKSKIFVIVVPRLVTRYVAVPMMRRASIATATLLRSITDWPTDPAVL